MSLIRWRNRSTPPSRRGDLETFLGNMFERFPDIDLGSHLPEAFRRGPVPAMNVVEGEEDVTVSVELPGLMEEDIRVELMGHVLTVSGERKWESEKNEKKDLHQVETQYGAFERSVTLPDGLKTDPDCVTASYKKGMLEVVVPKVEPTPVSQIKVTSD